MGSFLQTDAWAKFKEKYGWHPLRLGDVLVLARSLWLGRTLLYAPETTVGTKPLVQNLLQEIRTIADSKHAIVFRLEIALSHNETMTQILRELGFRKSFETVQPEWRAVVDLRSSNEDILYSMHQKGRYNIRVAERHGIAVKESDDVEAFYDLFIATARRERFSPRAKQYFINLLSMIPGAKLFIASYNTRPLAAALVIFQGKMATYLYGASSNEHREKMAPYLLHWEVMKRAKASGCETYDLGEIAPVGAANHPLQGLTDFKMKFGAQMVHLLGAWDYVYRPLWYTAFFLVEKLRRGFRARISHQ